MQQYDSTIPINNTNEIGQTGSRNTTPFRLLDSKNI